MPEVSAGPGGGPGRGVAGLCATVVIHSGFTEYTARYTNTSTVDTRQSGRKPMLIDACLGIARAGPRAGGAD